VSFGSYCRIFYPVSNGGLAKLIGIQIKKLQFVANFYFVSEGFQC